MRRTACPPPSPACSRGRRKFRERTQLFGPVARETSNDVAVDDRRCVVSGPNTPTTHASQARGRRPTLYPPLRPSREHTRNLRSAAPRGRFARPDGSTTYPRDRASQVRSRGGRTSASHPLTQTVEAMSACVSRRVQRAWRAVQVPAARSRQVEVEALRARFERRVILMPRDIIATIGAERMKALVARCPARHQGARACPGERGAEPADPDHCGKGVPGEPDLSRTHGRSLLPRQPTCRDRMKVLAQAVPGQVSAEWQSEGDRLLRAARTGHWVHREPKHSPIS
jgi:hypothetical protein